VDEQLRSGVLAIFIGALAGFLLLVPFVALSYRRRGRLTAGRAMLWGSALVYFWAIWTYTLLPLPDSDSIRCAGVNLDVWAFVDDIRSALARPGPTITDPAVLQLLLNVALFVPLGSFLRVLGGRGVVVAGLVGLAVSAFVETTQLTGVWGIYPCAYRVFDVDDMLTNTLGAVAGSIAALAVPARLRRAGRSPDAHLPRPVTRRRRALGMLCDFVGITLVVGVVGVVVQMLVEFVLTPPGGAADSPLASIFGTTVGSGVWLVVILATGRSVGDFAVRVRFTRGALPEWLARVVRFAAGAGGYTLLAALPEPWDGTAFLLWISTVVLLFVYRDGRGLPGVIGNRAVVDDRAPQAAPASPSRLR
jgi:hypothetical protein